jgi:hypothetical protein
MFENMRDIIQAVYDIIYENIRTRKHDFDVWLAFKKYEYSKKGRAKKKRREFYYKLYSNIHDKNCLCCVHINGGKCKKTGHTIDSGIAGERHSKDCKHYKYAVKVE